LISFEVFLNVRCAKQLKSVFCWKVEDLFAFKLQRGFLYWLYIHEGHSSLLRQATSCMSCQISE
jgi:hypothetical protein